MKDREQPDWLRQHLNTLPSEIDPPRDLWLGVAKRLTAQSRLRPGNIAMAAVLLISLGFSVFGWQAYRSAESERAATAGLIAGLLAPYEQSRAETAARWSALEARLDPKTLSIFTAEREKLDTARALLMDALHKDPADPALHRLMQQVIGQETELLESGSKISSYTL